ncbi:Serine/threonine-protein phosphatase, partial [Caligus rogercresseyi]
YKYMFDDKLITVWSAPNYCYRCGNVASILKVNDVDNREPVIFSAVPDTNRVIPSNATILTSYSRTLHISGGNKTQH